MLSTMSSTEYGQRVLTSRLEAELNSELQHLAVCSIHLTG